YSTKKPHLLRCIRLHSTKECGAHAPCIWRFLANIPAFLTSQIHPTPGHHRSDYSTAEVMQNTYCYRPMQIWLDQNGCHRNLMKANGLLSEIRHRRRWQQVEPGRSLIHLFYYSTPRSSLFCTVHTLLGSLSSR